MKTAELEWRMRSIREETRTITPDYSTYQNRDNNLYIKFRDYKEEATHESEIELDMLIIDNGNEPEEELDIDDDYDPDAYYYYTTDSEEEDNPDYQYNDGTPLEYLYMDSYLSDSEEDLPKEKGNTDPIIYPKKLRLSSTYIWEIKSKCEEIEQIGKKDLVYVDNFDNIRIMKHEEDTQSKTLMELADYVVEDASSSYRPDQSFVLKNEFETMEYNIGCPLRKPIPIYNNENPLDRTTGIRASPERTFFRKDDDMLNITEIDP